MTILKILSLILGLVVITKTIHDYKKKKESFIMFLFWMIIWIAIIILGMFPLLIDRINLIIGGAGSGVNTFIGAAIVFLFFITYRVYTKANRIERQIHDMVMKLGLKNIDKD